MLVALGAVLVVAVGFTAASLNAPRSPAGPSEKLVEFKDEAAGFSVSYPRSWNRIEKPKDPLVRLLAGPPATDDTISVKVIRLPAKVVIDANTPAADIAAIQGTLDQIIDQLPGLTQVVQRNRLTVNGTPGWYYIYRFKDKGVQGVHFRYFMFEGDKEYIITFQAFPEDHFGGLAATFDRIIATFNFKLGQAEPTPSPSVSSSP